MAFSPVFIYGVLTPILAAAAKKSSSSATSLILILVIFGVGGYLLTNPQRKRRRLQQSLQNQVDVGDQVVTSSGIIGKVVGLGDDRVNLEIAPGTTIEVLRGSVGRRIENAMPPSSAPDDLIGHEDDEHDSRDDDPPKEPGSPS